MDGPGRVPWGIKRKTPFGWKFCRGVKGFPLTFISPGDHPNLSRQRPTLSEGGLARKGKIFFFRAPTSNEGGDLAEKGENKLRDGTF